MLIECLIIYYLFILLAAIGFYIKYLITHYRAIQEIKNETKNEYVIKNRNDWLSKAPSERKERFIDTVLLGHLRALYYLPYAIFVKLPVSLLANFFGWLDQKINPFRF